MSIEEVLVDRLEAQVALVASRVYPVKLPQDGALPALTYQQDDGQREQGISSDHGMAHPRFRVDSWAEGYADVKAVAAQVLLALERWSDPTTTPAVLDCLIDGDRDIPEPESKLAHVSMTFTLWHRE